MGRRPQPAVAGPDRARHRDRAVAGDVRSRRLAGAGGEVRPTARGAAGPSRGRPAARPPRRGGQRGVPVPAALPRRPAARPARRRRPRAAHAGGGPDRRRADGGCARPRRARPGAPDRDLRTGRPDATDGGVRLHGQGPRPADRGPPGQPLRPADRRPVRRGGGRAGRRPGGSLAPADRPRGRPVRVGGDPAAAVGGAHHHPAAGPGRARPGVPGPALDPGDARARPDRPRPRRSRRGRADRDGQPGRREQHQHRGLDQQGRGLVGAGPPGLVRRGRGPGPALARDQRRAARRARHRRDQPGRAAGRAGLDLVDPGPAAAADRHGLRPVRRPRARTVGLRDLRRWPVDPGRHAVGRDAGSRGRGAPEHHHPVHRAGDARCHGVRAGLRRGDRVVPAGRAVPAGAPGRRVGLPAPDDPTAGPGARGPARGHRRAPS